MKKYLLLLLLISILSIDAKAQIVLDTVAKYYAGPGMLYTKINIASYPLSVDVLELDMKNPYLKLETVLAHDMLGGGLEVVSSMAQRNDKPNHAVVGAVNGDFFGSQGPIQMQVKDGQIVHKERTDGAYASIAFDNKGGVEFSSPVFSGSVITNAGSIAITDVNKVNTTNSLMLLNHFYDTWRDSLPEINKNFTIIHPINGFSVNDTVAYIVDAFSDILSNVNINENQTVLSANGTAYQFISTNVKIGDTIKIITRVTPSLKQVTQLIGGHPFIMQNGVMAPVDLNDGLLKDRHPRTIVGINSDTSKVYIVVIDGRTTSSIGSNIHEMVDFLQRIKVHQAVNLDGGGSTTMVIRGNVVNYPSSGGTERAVGNSLMAISTAPIGSLNSVLLTKHSATMFRDAKFQFTARGTDEYYNPIALHPDTLKFTLSSNFGSITNTGLFTAGKVTDSGYVYVNYKNFKDSAFVVVNGVVRIQLTPESVTTDTVRPVKFTVVSYDLNNKAYTLAANEYKWISENPEVGTIDSMGNFKGLKSGTTKIIATIEKSADTSFVTVDVRNSTDYFDSFQNFADYSLSGENIDLANSSIAASTTEYSHLGQSLVVNYKFKYENYKQAWINIDLDKPILGVPDTIKIDCKSDGQNHHIVYSLSDDNNEMFTLNTGKYANYTAGFDTIKAATKNIVPVAAGTVFNYPVRLKQIKIKLASSKVVGQEYSGTLYIDNLRSTYFNVISSLNENENLIVTDYSIEQNYPNPFNPSTTIKYALPFESNVKITIYNIVGEAVKEIVNEVKQTGLHQVQFNASHLSSGVYFYMITANSTSGKDNFSSTKKMMLVK